MEVSKGLCIHCVCRHDMIQYSVCISSGSVVGGGK